MKGLGEAQRGSVFGPKVCRNALAFTLIQLAVSMVVYGAGPLSLLALAVLSLTLAALCFEGGRRHG